jgi:hypothetical protein
VKLIFRPAWPLWDDIVNGGVLATDNKTLPIYIKNGGRISCFGHQNSVL